MEKYTVFYLSDIYIYIFEFPDAYLLFQLKMLALSVIIFSLNIKNNDTNRGFNNIDLFFLGF